MISTSALARSRIDERLQAFGATGTEFRPHKGWIRAIRDALGMSGRELADRMGVTQSTIPDIERSEQRGTIRIETLARAADALDCDLVYLLKPRRSLDDLVAAQARRKAIRVLGWAAQHSLLEDQSVTTDELDEQIDDLAVRFIDRRGLWTDSVELSD